MIRIIITVSFPPSGAARRQLRCGKQRVRGCLITAHCLTHPPIALLVLYWYCTAWSIGIVPSALLVLHIVLYCYCTRWPINIAPRDLLVLYPVLPWYCTLIYSMGIAPDCLSLLYCVINWYCSQCSIGIVHRAQSVVHNVLYWNCTQCSISIAPCPLSVLHTKARGTSRGPGGNCDVRGDVVLNASQLRAVYDHYLIYYGSVKTIASLVMWENAYCAL